MAQKRTIINAKRWPGVYGYESNTRTENGKENGKADICYYITFAKADGSKKVKVWEKIGWKSEGYSPQVASEVRAERLRKIRHGEEVKTAKEIRTDKQLHNRAIGEIAQAYFDSPKGKQAKGRGTDLNRYKKHLAEPFAEKTVDLFCPFDVERLKHTMADLAPATVANALELLRRIVNYGVEHKLCPPPSFTIKLPKISNQITEYLTPEAAARLKAVLDSWPDQDAARMLKLAWLTGLRRGEIFKLEDRDIDFGQGLVALRDPKGGTAASIPMSRPVAELLKTQMSARDERHPGKPFVFPGRGGTRRKDSSAVERIKEAAELPKSFRIFHGLRHHLAVTLISSGAFTLDMVGELLTHKDSKVTRRYAKFLPDAKKQAADRAAAILQDHALNGHEEKVVSMESRK